MAAAQPLERSLPEPIGRILGAVANLKPRDVERVIAYQQRKGVRFGEAACSLRLVTQADVEHALARQFDLPYLRRGAAVSGAVVAAYAPRGPQAEALRAIRDQLVLRWLDREAGSKTLAIASAGRGEGRSFIAANLAVVFAQLGHPTLLVDADLRNSSQHRLFGLDNRLGLSGLLLGRAGIHEALQEVESLPELRVLPAGVTPPNPQDLLLRPAFAQLLRNLRTQAAVVIIDGPAANCTDAQTIAVRAGAVLVVARKHASRLWRVQAVSATLGEARAQIVGAVLNEF